MPELKRFFSFWCLPLHQRVNMSERTIIPGTFVIFFFRLSKTLKEREAWFEKQLQKKIANQTKRSKHEMLAPLCQIVSGSAIQVTCYRTYELLWSCLKQCFTGGKSGVQSSALMQLQKRGIKQRKMQRRNSKKWLCPNKFKPGLSVNQAAYGGKKCNFFPT